MAVKDKVVVTIEKTSLGVKLIVETEKRPGETVRNLEIEAKEIVLNDGRTQIAGPEVEGRDAPDPPAHLDPRVS